MEGILLKALKNGYWLFLDEINLAPAEVLHTLAAVLESASSHVPLSLMDRGSIRVEKHPNFRLIGAMNPATDFGKRDLAASLRNKFTEIWFSEPDSKEDLEMIVAGYLGQLGPTAPLLKIVEFYVAAKEATKGDLTDGAGQSPCYSLRTLCRCLEYVQRMAPAYGIAQALVDGASMTFLTQLDCNSVPKMTRLIQWHFANKAMKPSESPKPPPCPKNRNAKLFGRFWIETGGQEIPAPSSGGKLFILTSSIEVNLHNLARAASLRSIFHFSTAFKTLAVGSTQFYCKGLHRAAKLLLSPILQHKQVR